MNKDDGTGNGFDPGDPNDPPQKGRVIQFPSKSKRKEKKREKNKREKLEFQNFQKAQKMAEAARASANGQQPFFNLEVVPPFTRIFIGLILLIHIADTLFLDNTARMELYYNFGFVSGAYTGTHPWSWSAIISPLSYALIHGGWMHILLNTVMGLAFGIMFERTYGTRSMILFFTLCTLGAAGFHLLLAPYSTAPIIGASGGISGLFAAFLWIMYKQKQDFMSIPARYGPWPILIFWGALLSVPGIILGEAIAWQAHLGGYLTGLAYIWVLQRRLRH